MAPKHAWKKENKKALPGYTVGECPKCVPGSGKPIGHRGIHVTVTLEEKAAEERERLEMRLRPCPTCVAGSGKLVRKFTAFMALPAASIENRTLMCSRAVGIVQFGHKGRCASLTEAQRQANQQALRVSQTQGRSSEPCPKCVAGSGKLLGHRGKHATRTPEMIAAAEAGA